MTEDLKKGILIKINDTLETLKLRLMLNKETIVLEKNEDKHLKEAIEFYQNIALQNKQAKSVIQECELTINKLELLKKHLTDLSLDAILHFYHNYETVTMATFKKQLNLQISTAERS